MLIPQSLGSKVFIRAKFGREVNNTITHPGEVRSPHSLYKWNESWTKRDPSINWTPGDIKEYGRGTVEEAGGNYGRISRFLTSSPY